MDLRDQFTRSGRLQRPVWGLLGRYHRNASSCSCSSPYIAAAGVYWYQDGYVVVLEWAGAVDRVTDCGEFDVDHVGESVYGAADLCGRGYVGEYVVFVGYSGDLSAV